MFGTTAGTMPITAETKTHSKMGEYVTHNGQSVKIGTCESLYYVTLEQFKKELPRMRQESGNLPPAEYLNPSHRFRFRFPFPDEKDTEIGNYQNHDRGYLLRFPKKLGVEIHHSNMFFRTDSIKKNPPPIGINIHCPVSENFPKKLNVYDWSRSREHTAVEVLRQGIVTDHDQIQSGRKTEIQTIVRCPYCGELSRLSFEEVSNINAYFQNHGTDADKEICEIMLNGYTYSEPCETQPKAY